MKRDFILEIGTEELPTSFIRIGMEGLYNGFENFLGREKIDYDNIDTYSTPRRLTVYIKGLSEEQKPIEKKIKGPPYKAAFDENGNPLPAALGFAKRQGVEVEDLVVEEEGKNKYVYAIKKEEGKKTKELLSFHIPFIVEKLYFPKTMLWGEGSFRFARPIHWILALFGEEVVDLEVAGIKSGNYTFGHRFIFPSKIEIERPEVYEEKLRDAYVISDRRKRRATIEKEYKRIAQELGGEEEIPSLELLDEVTDLVEYPTVMRGSFSEEYLELPKEVPVSVMKDHQRYFPIYKGKKLLPYFVFVSNTKEENRDTVVKGNERVLRARLEDAMFYFKKDREIPLRERVKELKKVVFHKELGTLYDKVERVREISLALLEFLDRKDLASIVDEVAYLSKADLATYMVREFPELEGVMGREYALLEGLPEEIAMGIYEHYFPKNFQDQLPKTWGGKVVSIADKLDTIFSYFSIDLLPTGSFDPYGLRRKAQGVVAILVRDKDIDVPFCTLLELVYRVMSKSGIVKIEHLSMVKGFFVDRIKNMLAMEGIKYDIINTVVPDGNIGSLKALLEKAKIFNNLYNTETFKNVVLVYNRLNNILKKFSIKEDPQKELFNTPFEEELFDLWKEKRIIFNEFLKNREYNKSLEIIDNIKPVIDRFFDSVLVMDKDERIKENRLRLLNFILRDLRELGDFSKIEGLV